MEHFNGRQSSPQTWDVLDWAFLFCFKGRGGGGSDAIKSLFSALNLTWIWGFSVNLTELFLQPTTSTRCWACARNSPAKEAAKSQGAVITLCSHIHEAPAKAALPPSGQGHGVAKEKHPQPVAQALVFYSRSVLQLHVFTGLWWLCAEEFLHCLFIWETRLQPVLRGQENTLLLPSDRRVCSNTASSTLRRRRGTLGPRLVYISADSPLSLFHIPLIAWQEKYREDTEAIWLTVPGAGDGWQGKGAQRGYQPSSSKKQNIWLPLISGGKLSYKNL